MSNTPPNMTLATLLSDPREFNRQWLATHGYCIKADGSVGGGAPAKHQMFRTLYLDYEQQLRGYNLAAPKGNKLPAITRESMSDALDELIRLERESQVVALCNELACTGESLRELEKFVVAVTGKSNALAVAGLAHFIMLIKRKMLGLPVTWHLMPILVGPQGVGKSTAIKELLKPLADVTKYLKLDELTDSRCAQALENNYVIVCDEMMGSARTEIETLKNRVTAETVAMRPMRSNDVVNVKVNVTFIGSTNKDIASLIKDNTGMRRFLPIQCQDKLMTGIYGIDFLALWRGINEHRKGTYLDNVKDELAATQKEIETPEEVALFAEEYGLAVGPGTTPSKILASSLYGTFKRWAEHHNYYVVNAVHFGRRLSTVGIKSMHASSGGCKVLYYIVSKSGLEALRSDIVRVGDVDDKFGNRA